MKRRHRWICNRKRLLHVPTYSNKGGEGLKIRKLQVPTVVQNGTQSSVVLDCDYILEPEANGLVVKWFFNDHPNPVYQWIPNKRPQDLGVLKGKLNLDYKASEDESKVHRALQIINPTIELSGEYRCVVSTFDDEAAETKKMVIFVPERTMQLTQTKPREDQLMLRCTAEGVYPKPNMTISSSDRLDKGHVHVDTLSRNGVYDIVASMTLDEKDLMSPTTFDCVLRIPEANYTVRKSAVYYPDGSGGGSNWIEPMFTTTLLFAWLSVRL